MPPVTLSSRTCRSARCVEPAGLHSRQSSWIKHSMGFLRRSAQIAHFLRVRDDKVTGAFPLRSTLSRSGNFNDIEVFQSRWHRLRWVTTFKRAYIFALGLVDSATQVLTRDGSLARKQQNCYYAEGT